MFIDHYRLRTENLYAVNLKLFCGNMKIWKISLLCIIIGLISIPSALAEEEYTISPFTQDSENLDNLICSILSTQYISQGQTITHNVNVGSGVNYLEVDLNWGDTSDSLTLNVYTPSGSKLGTYRDSSDGGVNGRIHFNIDPSQGYVAQGTWKFKVYGESVSGTESYTITVGSH